MAFRMATYGVFAVSLALPACSEDYPPVPDDCRLRVRRQTVVYSPESKSNRLTCIPAPHPLVEPDGTVACLLTEQFEEPDVVCSAIPGRRVAESDTAGTKCVVEQRGATDAGLPGQPGWFFDEARYDERVCGPSPFRFVPGSEPAVGTRLTLECVLEQEGDCT